MDNFREILNQVYLDNTVRDYLLFIGLILLGVIFLKYLSKLFSNLIYTLFKKRFQELERETFFEFLHKPLSWLIMLIILFTATSHITYPERLDFSFHDMFNIQQALKVLFQLFLIITVTWVGLRIIDFSGLIFTKKAERSEVKQEKQLVIFAVESIKVIAVILAVFIILASVFNVNIASLIAGLGIGGLAIALAAKETLENLFGSFTIFLDRPFELGDMVKVGDVIGSVEKIGFRSTRIRTLEKSYVTLPNKKMVDAELDNLSLRTFRRVNFTIGLLYNTPVDTIKQIVADIQQYIDENPNTNQDGQVKFENFGDFSLDIMVMYFIDTMDWTVFLKVKEEINYQIIEIVHKRGADFAFPTRTVHLEKAD